MIDVLGGLNINVEQRMYFPEEEIDLQAGLQKLNGHDALSYVRWRSDGKGDIGRIERQQKFFRALADQALTFSTIWKIPDLLDELNKYVKTDMKLQKMIVLANKLRDIENIELEATVVPGTPDDINYGASYWIPDKEALVAILEGIYGEESNLEKTSLSKTE
jgi:anionic cell wall polymer biosynthesis LytR-Cps2A-Psr (LCP) family protein